MKEKEKAAMETKVIALLGSMVSGVLAPGAVSAEIRPVDHPPVTVEASFPARWSHEGTLPLRNGAGSMLRYRDAKDEAHAVIYVIDPETARAENPTRFRELIISGRIKAHVEDWAYETVRERSWTVSDAAGVSYDVTGRWLRINGHDRYVTFAFPTAQRDDLWVAIWLRSGHSAADQEDDLAAIMAGLSVELR